MLSSYEGEIPVEQARELVDKIGCDAKTKLTNYFNHDYVNMMTAGARENNVTKYSTGRG